MTDREKKESLKQCLSASCRGFRTCPYDDRVWNAVETVLELLEEQEPVKPTVGGWISVKDRLPENTNHVLVRCRVSPFNKHYTCIAMYVRDHELSEGSYPDDAEFYDYDEGEDEYYLKAGWYEIGRNFDDYGSAPIEDFVTHWMPLPEPPEGVSGDG